MKTGTHIKLELEILEWKSEKQSVMHSSKVSNITLREQQVLQLKLEIH
jgi:DNA-binding CsgD family transcriptional regulator